MHVCRAGFLLNLRENPGSRTCVIALNKSLSLLSALLLLLMMIIAITPRRPYAAAAFYFNNVARIFSITPGRLLIRAPISPEKCIQEIFALAAPIDIAAASNFISPRGLLY